MRKNLVLVVVAMMATVSGMAQFPANVKEVLKMCDEKIDKDTYYLRELRISVGLALATMTVTKVTKGCSDSWFKIDMNRYKNAV